MCRAAELGVVWLWLWPCCVTQQTGGAVSGCEEGFYGEQCNILCSMITHRCIQCTKDGQCTGCSENLKPQNCTVCEDGYYKYGSGCDQCSSYCKHRRCDPDSGACSDCPEGRYGALCQSACNKNCTDLTCHHSTGRCHNCGVGYHGDHCGFPCSTITDRCTQCTQEGQCTACSSHFKPPDCTECEAGLFGKKCSKTCGHCRDNATCHHVTGHCQAGCAPGFTGLLCVEQDDEEEGPKSAVIVGAVFGVLLVVAVVVIIAVIIIVRRRRQADKTHCDNIPFKEPAEMSQSSKEQGHDAVTGGSDNTLPYTNALTNSLPACNLDLTISELPPNSEPTPDVEESFYYEIVERENTYDKLHPYSNEGGERELYSELTSRDVDVTTLTASSSCISGLTSRDVDVTTLTNPAYINMTFKD